MDQGYSTGSSNLIHEERNTLLSSEVYSRLLGTYQSKNVKSRDESCVQNDQSLGARGTDSDSTPKGEAEARP